MEMRVKKTNTDSHARYAFADGLFSSFVIIADISRSLATSTLSCPFVHDFLTVLEIKKKNASKSSDSLF
jgi:hypothetical protein